MTKPLHTNFHFPCNRCGGTGNTGHKIADGVCFKCGGNGINESAFNAAVIEFEIKKKEMKAEQEKEDAAYAAELAKKGKTATEDWFDTFLNA